MICPADASAAFVGAQNSYVSVWLTNMVAWEPDGDLTQSNDPPRHVDSSEPISPYSVDHYRGGVWRFAWSEDKSILLDNLEGQAAAYCDWYRIRWHECDHDADDRQGCQWDEIRSGGTIPEGVTG